MAVLNILISTIDANILKVRDILLPFRDDVVYVVSHQYTSDEFKIVPQELKRPDVIVSQIFGKGLTISRNNAIKIAECEICIIADDDVKYSNKYFDEVIQVYQDENIDVACFKIKTREGEQEYKKYPIQKMKLNSISEHSPSSIEITFRLRKVKIKDIKFDYRFGLGSPLGGGGENLFIHDCIQAGLNVYFLPIYIVEHPFESTIKSFPKYHPRRNKVRGALDYRLNGKTSFVRSFIVTLKSLPDLIKHKKNPFIFLAERISGSLYILNSESKE